MAEKDHDLFAWRAFREQIGDELEKIPADLAHVAERAPPGGKSNYPQTASGTLGRRDRHRTHVI